MTLQRTHQKTEDGGQRAAVWLRLRRVFFGITLCATFLSSVLSPLPSDAATEVARPVYTPPPPAVSSANIAQIVFSLLLVLAAVVLVAWLLKRMNIAKQGSGNLLKVLGSVAVGQRERIVLVEIEDTWLVIGVGPGQIRTLHTLEKSAQLWNAEQTTPVTRPVSTNNKFASLLSSVLKRRDTGKK